MVKLFGPLHSDGASGSVGRPLTYSERKSGSQVRYQRKQKDVITSNRTTQRAKFNLGLELWTSMPGNEKDYWKIAEKDGFVNI
jgi:hypothetical protein